MTATQVERFLDELEERFTSETTSIINPFD